MGAATFDVTVPVGRGVREAFSEAREQAQWDHGHSGYTGTIAEKPGYLLVEFPEGLTAADILDALDQSGSYWTSRDGKMVEVPAKRPEWADEVVPTWDTVVKTYNDKWDDAIAFVRGDKVTFCGWASY